MLLKWFIQLTFNNKPSSIRTYHSRISRKFLEYSEELDLANFDEVDFEGFYLSIINLSDTETSKGYVAGRLQALHKLAVIEFNFPCLPGNLRKSKSIHHIRAGVIPEILYRGVLNTINQLSDINKTEKLTLLTIVIIAYRTGLRIGEILKLLLKDIEESSDL